MYMIIKRKREREREGEARTCRIKREREREVPRSPEEFAPLADLSCLRIGCKI